MMLIFRDTFEGTTPTGLGCMALASVGALLFGIDNGWWSTLLGAEAFLRDFGSCSDPNDLSTCNLSTSQQSGGSSAQSGGIMVSCLFAMCINTKLGRRLAIVITAIVSIIGVVIELTSVVRTPRFSQFVVSKTIASIAIGLACNIVPIYLSETSPGKARGAGINLYQNVMIVSVISAASCVYGTSTHLGKSCYLIPMGLQLIPPALMLAFSPFLPESPRWLVWNGKIDEATISAQRLFGSKTNGFSSAEYVSSIAIAVEGERANKQDFSNWLDLFKGADLRRLLIAAGIQSWQQAQGSSYMNSYVTSFLKDVGVKNTFPIIMGLDIIYWAAILSGHFLSDMFGRRPIIMASSMACGAMLLIVAILKTAVTNLSESESNACIALIFLWNVSFGVLSPLIWIVTAESAPTRNRERLLATAVFLGFGVSLLITSVSPFIQDVGYGNIGSKIGFIWASASFACTAWVFFFVPEMKGFSLEQLDYLFANKTPTRRFGKIHFEDDILADGIRADEQMDQKDDIKKNPDVSVTQV